MRDLILTLSKIVTAIEVEYGECEVNVRLDSPYRMFIRVSIPDKDIHFQHCITKEFLLVSGLNDAELVKFFIEMAIYKLKQLTTPFVDPNVKVGYDVEGN